MPDAAGMPAAVLLRRKGTGRHTHVPQDLPCPRSAGSVAQGCEVPDARCRGRIASAAAAAAAAAAAGAGVRASVQACLANSRRVLAGVLGSEHQPLLVAEG